MLFNSVSFAIFLPIVFILYWFAANKKREHQNLLLLLAGYVFYSWWDWRFTFLLLFSTLLDYFAGLRIHASRSVSNKKTWLWLSIAVNLGVLIVCKYFNFFAGTFSTALQSFGFHPSVWTLNIVLPIGISFYTFHGLSYIIDIYKERITPEKNIINYALFVNFFPLLVAGPIERATHLLPQIRNERTFNYHQAVNGLRQILWGLFKKMVIADSCAVYTDIIFSNSDHYPGSTLLLGAFFFSIQIYADFSGYSDIAIGTAKLFGIELLRNFAYPYFSRDIAEFWRRWHISLTTWFRDYVYIPLGGSKGSKARQVRNVFIIFIISGFWHGANWTFIAWGMVNAVLFIPLLLSKKHRDHIDIVAYGRTIPTAKDIFRMLLTFIVVMLTWIFFRAENISHAIAYFQGLFSPSLFSFPVVPGEKGAVTALVLVLLFMLVEWNGRQYEFPTTHIGRQWKRIYRWTFYAFIVFLIGMFMQTTETPFIYFQF